MKFLIIVGLAITSSVFAEGPEQNYSNYALSLANKYRSKSMTGIKGIALLSLACFLDPENDEAVLVQMNNTKPKKPKKNLNEEKLLLAFLKRADDIRLNLYPKNEDAAVVASAYYLIVELFKPVNHQIILGLGAFKADDQAYTIDTVFETKINPVTALNKRGIKPYRARGVGSKTDKKIADLIARKAAQLLSKNKTDTKAIQMLGVAGYIDPMNKTFLLTAGLLSKDKIEKQNLARIDLIPALELRAKKLFSGKSKKAIQLAYLYFLTIDLVDDKNKTAMRGLKRLITKGYELPLDEFLEKVAEEEKNEQKKKQASENVIIPKIMRLRKAKAHSTAVLKYGGSTKGQRAVIKALKWLASVQKDDGSWAERPAHTGMALLVFLAHGETTMSKDYGKTVLLAIQYLHNYATGETMMKSRAYIHGIATMAIAEAYAMTGIPYLKKDMENCVQRIIDGQQGGGGFDYHYKKGARWDLSVAGWQFQALKASRVAGATNEGLKNAIEQSIRFFPIAFKGNKFGYSSAGSGGNMTGVGTFSMQIMGAGNSDEVKGGLKTIEMERINLYNKLSKEPKQWGSIAASALYGWYYDTQAMFHQGGLTWKKWRKVFEPVLIKAQNKKGYWETTGGHSMGPTPTGRVLSTCWAALQLEVYYRYKQIKKKK